MSRWNIQIRKNIGFSSLICSITGWLVLAFSAALRGSIPWDINMILWVLGLSLGVLFFICPDDSESQIGLKFNGMVKFLTISSIVAFVLFLSPSLTYFTYKLYFQSAPCRDKLTVISDSIKIYAKKHNGQLPPAEKWCDALIQETGISPEIFICPNSGTKNGLSDFMMNKSVSGLKLKEIPSDVVLLFEATPSWNGVGGVNSLKIENHKDTGLNVLSGENPWFARTNDIKGLKWEI